MEQRRSGIENRELKNDGPAQEEGHSQQIAARGVDGPSQSETRTDGREGGAGGTLGIEFASCRERSPSQLECPPQLSKHDMERSSHESG